MSADISTEKPVPSIIYEIAGALAPSECPHIIDCSSASPSASSPKTTFQLPKGMTPLKFYREFVATSTPVVFKNAASHLPAIKKWTRKYLIEQLENRTKLKVSLTPQGWADAIVDVDIDDDADEGDAKGGGDKNKTTKKTRMFMSPAEQRMKCSEFFNALDKCRVQHNKNKESRKQQQDETSSSSSSSSPPPIAYMQAQNSCLLSDTFKVLVHDLVDDIDENDNDIGGDGDTTSDSAGVSKRLLARRSSIVRFGAELFGSPPDVCNIWFGCAASTTSLHQDWFENFYVAVRGTKKFKIIPPTDCAAIPKKFIREGTYEYDAASNVFKVVPEEQQEQEQEFMWIDFDEAEATKRGARVYSVDLEPGDVLYLPAMWYHQVGQQEDNSEKTENDDDRFVCAVNFWFDMAFGHRFHLQRFMKHLLGHPDWD